MIINLFAHYWNASSLTFFNNYLIPFFPNKYSFPLFQKKRQIQFLVLPCFFVGYRRIAAVLDLRGGLSQIPVPEQTVLRRNEQPLLPASIDVVLSRCAPVPCRVLLHAVLRLRLHILWLLQQRFLLPRLRGLRRTTGQPVPPDNDAL